MVGEGSRRIAETRLSSLRAYRLAESRVVTATQLGP